MQLDTPTIEKIAHLARLHLPAEEIEETKKGLNEILTFMEKLNELDTSSVAPLIYLNDQVNVFREDVVKHEMDTDAALRNAPAKEGPYFKVIKVLNK